MRVYNYIEVFHAHSYALVCRLSIDNLTDEEILNADENINKEMGEKYYTIITTSTNQLTYGDKSIKGGLMKFVNPKNKSRRAK